MDYLSTLGPPSSGYGTGLYDFGYQPTQPPPAQAAGTASQLESGGSGFDWNAALHDITGMASAWMGQQGRTSGAPGLPTNYRVNEQGQVYSTDPAYRGSTLGGAVGAMGGIPTAWLLIGGLILGAVMLAKE